MQKYGLWPYPVDPSPLPLTLTMVFLGKGPKIKKLKIWSIEGGEGVTQNLIQTSFQNDDLDIFSANLKNSE